jgi:uncharacterized protein
MDVVLIILAFVLIVAGFAGSIIPALPGPPLAFTGLLITYFTSLKPINGWWLIAYAIMVIIVAAADLWLPSLSTKLTKGTRQGAMGANIGMFTGLFVPIPFSIFVGAFIGSFAGELYSGKNSRQALIAACGVFIGLLGGIIIKCFLCILMLLHLMLALLL